MSMAYLVGHVNKLWCRSDRGTRDDAAILLDVGSLNDNDIQIAMWPVLGVKALIGC